MNERKKPTLAVIAISVIMIFAALATDFFWIAKWTANAFPPTMPVDEKVYNAFAVPDVVLSLLLYIGAAGLLRLRKSGVFATCAAMGMWLFDNLLVLQIAGRSRLTIIVPSLVFVLFTLSYLWAKRDLFE